MAGKHPPPAVVVTDRLASYPDVRYGDDTEHVQDRPFAAENNTQLIERFHETLKRRTKVMRGLKNTDSAHDFIGGWLVHYNYIRPHSSLDDRTPAEVAGTGYPYRNWADIVRHRPLKPVVIEHWPRSVPKLPDARPAKLRRRSRRRVRCVADAAPSLLRIGHKA